MFVMQRRSAAMKCDILPAALGVQGSRRVLLAFNSEFMPLVSGTKNETLFPVYTSRE